jgi:tripartite ATP-independent transporter DctP family solute receptor
MKSSNLLAVLRGGLFAVAAVTAAGGALAQTTVLKMAHVYNPGNIWYNAAESYKKAVEERTGGKVRIDISPSGSTGDWPQAIEALKFGTNHIVLQSIGTLDRYNVLAGLEAYPYLIRDVDHFMKVYYGSVGAEFADAVAKKGGYRIIGAGYRGARWLTTNKAVNSVDDVKGQKLRVPPLKMYKLTWEMLGAIPTPMGPAELYTSLQQGVVDGQENPLEFIDNYKFNEVQKYAVDTRHIIGAMTWIYSDAYFDKLPADVRKVLKEEGERTLQESSRKMVELEVTLRKKMEGTGVTFLSPDLAPFRARLADIGKEFPDLAPWAVKFQAVK